MFRLLQNIQFYSADRIREKMKEAHGIVSRWFSRNLATVKRSDILVSYLDGAGKSGAHYARVYADENEIYVDNIVELGKLSQALSRAGLKALVFVDDFLGSGGSATDYFKRLYSEHYDALRKSGVRIFFLAICGFQKAQAKVEDTILEWSLPAEVHVCDPLGESDGAFSEESAIFEKEADKTRAQNLAYHQGAKLVRKNPLGFGNCQALVVFDSSCPNNTLPIIWAETTEWKPLFKRL